MIAFVQPFGLHSAGGGPRILRAMLMDAPFPFVSVCTGVEAPPMTSIGLEIHLPARPSFRLLERGRLNWWTQCAERVLADRFIRRLLEVLKRNRCTAVHGLAHALDFWHAYRAAANAGLPYYLSIHDDLAYALQGRGDRAFGLRALHTVWNAARERIVISDELGEEYCRRYGNRSYRMVTDGLTEIPDSPRPRDCRSLRVYFMGLLHRSYIENFRALLLALRAVKDADPLCEVTLTCRCGSLPSELRGSFPIQLLPLASEREVAEDLHQSDVLYLPLPFGHEDEGLVRYSLSTKMVTYLGSGLPILYHGPSDAAAGRLLVGNNAASAVPNLNVESLIEGLHHVTTHGEILARHAIRLARERFLLHGQRERFFAGLGTPTAHPRVLATASV